MQPHASSRELHALIHLLDDPDATVHTAVRDRFRQLGPSVLPYLRDVLPSLEDSYRTLLGEVIHTLHFAQIERDWQHVMQHAEADLEQGSFLLARYRFADLEVAPYHTMLDQFAERIRSRVQQASGVQRAFVLGEFLWEELGFRGNTQHYYDPNNSYLNCVLDTRRGIPVSLSVVYLLLGQRLGLPVYGVNMPAHFLIKYEDGRQEVFLDLFNGGTPFLKEDGLRFLLKAGIKPRDAYFMAADTQTILLRMVRNLLAIAHEANQDQALLDLKRLLEPWDVGVE